ncbi:MAG TPA: malto-oligosyltrehalose trehalohydrolase [Acidimicrobiales bacterium]|nr:malto-oligosyltrehalose trehalohydrolase [Acidimicrobiales bacterium]
MIRVWAPHVARVELDLDATSERVALSKIDRHHHELVVDLPSGTDYWLRLDGGPRRADPRSAHQPEGSEGPSRVVDHAAFEWTDADWPGLCWPAVAIYEMHVGTFTPGGTFDSAVERLDHLVDLGVDTVEVMPVAEFPGRRGWGYDGVHLWAPQSSYGGPEGLKRFVDAAHARGLAVVLDVVYNHLGPAGNYLQEFGPYFTDRYSTPWGQAVNLDGPGSDGVRAHIVDNAAMWIRDFHIDGLRLDAVHAFLDTSATHLLEELAAAVHQQGEQLNRSVAVIAESDLNDPRLVRPVEEGGFGLDAAWSDDFHHAVHAALTAERDGYYEDFGSLADIAAAWEESFVYAGRYSAHRDRRHGRAAGTVEPTRFVVSLQNHDQVGNRAKGDRIGEVLEPDRLRAGAAITLLAPQVPLIFQGEEWAASTPFPYFTDHTDPDLAEAVRNGRRSEFAAFGWKPEDVPDPQADGTFRSAILDWDEIDREPHAGMLEWYRGLLARRRGLTGHSPSALSDDTAGRLALTREGLTIEVILGEPVYLRIEPPPAALGRETPR